MSVSSNHNNRKWGSQWENERAKRKKEEQHGKQIAHKHIGSLHGNTYKLEQHLKTDRKRGSNIKETSQITT